MKNKTIQRKYETEHDREEEIRLGEKYVEYMGGRVWVVNLGYLSTYDFKIFSMASKNHYGFLEVKKRSGKFRDWATEIIPITKWSFAKQTDKKCLMLVEKDDACILYDISEIVKNPDLKVEEIRRRSDQPEGSKKVVRFSTDYGKKI